MMRFFLRLKLGRRRDAIGFVFGINLAAKDGLIAAVDHHAEIIGLAVLHRFSSICMKTKVALVGSPVGLLSSRNGAKNARKIWAWPSMM